MRFFAMALVASIALGASAQFGEVVDVEVLEIDAVVFDAQGHAVAGLMREDFEVLLQGKPVEVTNFYSVAEGEIREPGSSEPPRPSPTQLVIFVDDVHLDPGTKSRAVVGLREFINARMDPHTTATIVRWNETLRTFTPPTRNRDELLRAVARLDAEPRRFDRANRMRTIQALAQAGVDGEIIRAIDGTEGDRDRHDAFDTLGALYTTIDRMRGLEGRKILLFVSRGIPLSYEDVDDPAGSAGQTASLRKTFKAVLEAAQQSKIVFTMVRPGMAASLSASFGALEQLARDTGGKVVMQSADVGDAIAGVTGSLTTYYSLGVQAPGQREMTGVQVRVRNRPDLRVTFPARIRLRARDERIGDTVRARSHLPTESNPLGATLRIGNATRMGNRCSVPLELLVPADDLTLLDGGGAVAIRMVVADAEQEESPLYTTTKAIRPAPHQIVRSATAITVRAGKSVLSAGVTDVPSAQTSYLQSVIDCR